MANPQENPAPNGDHVEYLGDGDLVIIREEDTRPGKPSERTRKWLEEKWGRKSPAPSSPKEPPSGS